MTLSGREFERLRHPRLIELSVFFETTNLVGSITEQRFPKLEILEVVFRDRGDQLGAIKPLRTLKRLTCSKVQVDTNFFKSITKRYFPKLETIEIDSRKNVFGRVFLDRQAQLNSIGIVLKSVALRDVWLQ